MPTLRSKLIRLAHKNPSLRADILPLLTKQAAAVTMKDVKRINDLTDRNAHTQALAEVAKLLGMTKYVKILDLVEKITDLEGHLPMELSKYRIELSDILYAKAKNTKVVDGDPKKSFYDLLD